MKTPLKLGTRKSLLAIAQSSWVARELEKLHKELSVELVGIETQGDIILDKPLSEIEGKEFFTAELDRALLKKEVDFTVHSFKDLSTERPPQLVLAATPKRELPHDIIIFHARTLEKLKNNEPLFIGTSSPRRLEIIPKFLNEVFKASSSKIHWQSIRGNVNTRISKIHKTSAATPQLLDGVVLALAGLERLLQDEKAAPPILELLQNTLPILLPIYNCPTAPAQGALAIEAHCDRPEVLEILKKIHHQKTLDSVLREREVLQVWGGGCHQKLGATVYTQDELIIKGLHPQGQWINEVQNLPHQKSSNELKDFYWVKSNEIFDFKPLALSESQANTIKEATHIFIAHTQAYDALSEELKKIVSTKTLWTPGSKTWKKLSSFHLWITGCTDGVGIDHLKELSQKKIFTLASPHQQTPTQKWVVLTHLESANAKTDAEASYSTSHTTIPTYTHQAKSIPSALLNAPKLYWPSGLCFETVLKSHPQQQEFSKKTHACGPGKTKKTLEKYGIFPEIINIQAQA